MMKNLSQQRALIFSMALGVLPLILVGYWFIGQNSRLREVEEAFDFLNFQAASKEKKQAQNISVQLHYKDSDHFYIDKHLETIVLLEPELEELQKLVDGSLPVTEGLKRRYEQLSGPQNALSFVEGQVHSFPTFQETTESLAHPVELNTSDLMLLLSRIEGVKLGEFEPLASRPQLIITDFKIDKKEISSQHEIYQLNLKLLKREYL